MARLVSSGFLAPPTVFIALCLAGALIAIRWRRSGLGLVLAASLCLYVAAMPAVSSYLLYRVESRLPATPDLTRAQAIVVLGGDVRAGDGAAVPDTLGPLSLERVVFATQAYRRLQLPVAVSGGRIGDAQQSEAGLMQAALEAGFAVPVTWTEGRSRTTWENALYTAPLLREKHLTTVVVVSQAWHLPRALWAFKRVGLNALPWPSPRTPARAGAVEDYLPSVAALQDTARALHEIIGAYYYRWRY